MPTIISTKKIFNTIVSSNYNQYLDSHRYPGKNSINNLKSDNSGKHVLVTTRYILDGILTAGV